MVEQERHMECDPRLSGKGIRRQVSPHQSRQASGIFSTVIMAEYVQTKLREIQFSAL
jgi:hypothetical protein